MLSRKPGWTILSLAGNDSRVGVPLDEFRATMTTYAKRLTSEVRGQVLFFGLGERGPDYPEADGVDERGRYYAVLKDIAAAVKGVHYVDLGPSIAQKARVLKGQHELHTICGDGGHLNAVGNLIMAGEMLRLFGVVTEA